MNKKIEPKLPALELQNLKAAIDESQYKLDIITKLREQFDDLEEAEDYYWARILELKREYNERLQN